MRYSLLLNYDENGGPDMGSEAMAEAQAAFDRYAKDLDAAGVLRGADVLQPTVASTTLSLKNGALQIQDGPFADSKEQLAGIFVIEVPDLDAALAWAEKCPAAQYGAIEIRPSAVYFDGGQWNSAM